MPKNWCKRKLLIGFLISRKSGYNSPTTGLQWQMFASSIPIFSYKHVLAESAIPFCRLRKPSVHCVLANCIFLGSWRLRIIKYLEPMNLLETQGSLIFTLSFFTPLDFTQSGEETVSKVSLFNLSELLFFSRHYTIWILIEQTHLLSQYIL